MNNKIIMCICGKTASFLIEFLFNWNYVYVKIFIEIEVVIWYNFSVQNLYNFQVKR